jgi:hypothetical protein
MIYTIETYNCYNLTCDNVASIVSIIMRICGIYYITNIINQIKYVGSSLDCYTRFRRHKADLIHNIHIGFVVETPTALA